jgi:hypothetical protein
LQVTARSVARDLVENLHIRHNAPPLIRQSQDQGKTASSSNARHRRRGLLTAAAGMLTLGQ